jgi:hypothetical protein
VEDTGEEPWFTQLDEVALRRRDQASFHVFAEGQHSDVRGEVKNLAEGVELTLPYPGWARHVFIVIGILGVVDVRFDRWSYVLRAQSQIVVLPGTACRLKAREASAIEVLSLLSTVPTSNPAR